MKPLLTIALSLALFALAHSQANTAATNRPPASAVSLTQTNWRLEDLNGHGVAGPVQSTLFLSNGGHATGSGGCNRFSAQATLSGDSIHFGTIGLTRKTCGHDVNSQEMKYILALESAERWKIDGATLLIFSKGADKPLRFTQFTPTR